MGEGPEFKKGTMQENQPSRDKKQQRHCAMCACRDGLFSRPSQSEQTQVSINMGQNFDLDNEVEGLTSQVGRLKRVCTLFTSVFARGVLQGLQVVSQDSQEIP